MPLGMQPQQLELGQAVVDDVLHRAHGELKHPELFGVQLSLMGAAES